MNDLLNFRSITFRSNFSPKSKDVAVDKNPFRHYIFWLIACFCFTSSAQAQSYLFSEPSITPSQLTTNQQSRYNKVNGPDNSYSLLKFVQINSPFSVQQNGQLTVNFSDSPCGQVVYTATNIDYTDSINYIWYGEMATKDSSDCLDGFLLLGSVGGLKYGSLRIGYNNYSIEELTGGLQVLAKMPMNTTSPVCTAASAPDAGSDPILERSTNCDIRVLTLFTTSAATITDPVLVANTNIAMTNQAFLNSSLSGEEIHLVSAGIEPISVLSESGLTFALFLGAVASNSTVAARRAATHADIVVVMVNHNILGTDLADGIAYLGFTGGLGSPSTGFAVIKINNNDGMTCAHEIGHILGANHETCNAEDAGIGCVGVVGLNHAHTWSFKTGIWPFKKEHHRRTILFSQGANNPDVILNYSNPSVSVQNHPTGTSVRNNATVLDLNACTVANYNHSDNDLSVQIVGPNFGCVGSGEAYEASLNGAAGPYTFLWRVSFNGGSTFTTISTTSSCAVNFPSTAGVVVVLTLTVSTSFGQSVTVSKTMQVYSIHDEHCRPHQGLQVKGTTVGENGMNAYPNPTSGVINIDFLLDEEGAVTIDIVNSVGSILRTIRTELLAVGRNSVMTDLKGLPNGWYSVNLRTATGLKTTVLSLLK